MAKEEDVKEHREHECAALRAEVTALQQQLQALAAQHASANTLARWRVSKRVRLVVLPVIVLLAAGGVLYGQGAMDALFINKDGNVGIGTTNPTHKFHVVAQDAVGLFESSGSQAFLRLSTNEGLENRVEITNRPGGRLSLWTRDEGDVFNITKNGKVGIGVTPKQDADAKLEVNGRIKDQTGYVMPVGSIVAYYGKTAPDGWLLCNGDDIPKEEKYKDLRTLLGKSTPDLRGRTLIGVGQGTGLSKRELGEQGGEETHKLTISEMPTHHHYGWGERNPFPEWPFGTEDTQKNLGSGSTDRDNYYYNTSDSGGGAPFNNMQPYYVVNYIIKY